MESDREIQHIKDTIEALPKNYHIEVGRILQDNAIKINENQNGLFINLTNIDVSIIKKLQGFLEYVDLQESHLNVIENAKEGLKDSFFKTENGTHP